MVNPNRKKQELYFMMHPDKMRDEKELSSHSYYTVTKPIKMSNYVIDNNDTY